VSNLSAVDVWFSVRLKFRRPTPKFAIPLRIQSSTKLMDACIAPCYHARSDLVVSRGGLKILPLVVEGGVCGLHPPCSPRASTVPAHRRTKERGPPARRPTRLPTSQGGYDTNKPAHDGTGDNLKPWETANQRVAGISPASDQVVLASRYQEKPVAPDEPVPWSQGTMVTNEPKTPTVLETMTHGFHQHLGSQEKMALKPAGAPWEVETMERRAIVPMTQVTLNTTWYQDRSRPRSQDPQETG
jgi:hypothetical protein